MPETEPWDYTLHIPHDLRAVTVCRRTVRLILTLHGLIRLADVAELLAA
ncbi:ATP-binding protein, partial [Streptomyces sp. NPDC005141]